MQKKTQILDFNLLKIRQDTNDEVAIYDGLRMSRIDHGD